MDIQKLIELVEKYPKLPVILQAGQIASYHLKYGLDIDDKEYKELILEMIKAKIITIKSNYMRASNEALEFLGERELDLENIRRLEVLYPGILGMFEGGISPKYLGLAYNISKEAAQKIIADAITFGLLRCRHYKLFIPVSIKQKLKELKLLD